MYHLFCAGLTLRSDRPIPGLIEVEEPDQIDVEVSLGEDPPAWAEGLDTGDRRPRFRSEWTMRGHPTMEVWTLDDGEFSEFRFWDGIRFLVDRNGARVRGTWAADMTLEDAATYLLGPILGYVLRARGITALHASVVEIASRVVAFVGPAGYGKSTVAAAFARRGCRVLSDDLAPLFFEEGELKVHPSYPVVRLWDASTTALYGSPEALPVICPSWDKRYLDLRDERGGFGTEPRRMDAVYLLSPRRGDVQGPSIRPESDNSALVSLVANTNASYLMDAEMRAKEFEFLGRVVRELPVRRLQPETRIERIDRLCDLVVDDVEAGAEVR